MICNLLLGALIKKAAGAAQEVKLFLYLKIIHTKEKVQTSVCDIYAQRTMNCTIGRKYKNEIHSNRFL